MAFDWNSLKKNIAGNVLNNGYNKNEDERFWRLSADKDGNGTAVVRLLPGKENTPPIVRIYKHGIFLKVQDKWRVYNNISPATVDLPCPVSDAYFELKEAAKNDKSLEPLVQKIARRTVFYTNAKVVNDLTNQDNNGKIKIFEYGSSVFNLIMELLEPNEQQQALGVKPKALFNPLNGNNIVVSRSGKGLNTKYTVTAQDQSPICQPEEVENLINSTYDLSEFINPETIKSYDQLKEEFAKTIAGTEIEAALLRIGSKVITHPYGHGATQTASQMANQAVPNVNVQPNVQTQNTQQNTQSQPNVQVESTVQPTNQTNQTATVDDLDALLADM